MLSIFIYVNGPGRMKLLVPKVVRNDLDCLLFWCSNSISTPSTYYVKVWLLTKYKKIYL